MVNPAGDLFIHGLVSPTTTQTMPTMPYKIAI